MNTQTIITILILTQILLGLIGIVMLLRIIYIATSFLRGDVPYVPTLHPVARRMAELAGLKPGMKVCDLGSGSGTILIALGKKEPKALITGYEIAPLLRFATRCKLLFYPQAARAITLRGGSFFKADFSDCEVVTCFLLRTILSRLYPQFLQLKSGTKLISHMFPLEYHDGFSLLTVQTERSKDSIYIYTRI